MRSKRTRRCTLQHPAAWLATQMVLLTLALGCGQSESSLRGASEAWPIAVADRGAAVQRAAFIRSRQLDAGAAYAFAERGSARPQASNPAQGFEVELGERGARVRGARWSLELGLARFGRQGGLEPVSSRQAPRAATTRGPRASLWHGAELEQWYLNGPLGLEQGFTIRKAPSGAGPLVVELELGGELEPVLGDDGQHIELCRPNGAVAAVYSDLWAFDARGELLAARMELRHGRLWLVVDDREARYPLEVDPLIWVERSKLLATDGVAGDNLGLAVSASGDSALVGAPYDDEHTGAAYLFARTATAWTQRQKLTASDAVSWVEFGTAVSLSGEAALVGAPLGEAGSAYLFVRSASSWTEQRKLTASDGADSDLFGNAVSLGDETMLVGAYEDDDQGDQSGSAYLFARSAASWTEQRKLTASDGAPNDHFGTAVSLSGETAVVSTDEEDHGTGSVYVFVRDAAAWSEQEKLTAEGGTDWDYFGSAVSLDGETALVGAPGNSENGDGRGLAYAFVRSAAAWSLQSKLTADDAADSDFFGHAVSLSGDVALVSAIEDDDDAGSAYVFVRTAASWSQEGKLTASDRAPGDYFGTAVSLSANTALVGATEDNDEGDDPGSAYVFVWGKEDGDSCADARECAKGHCVDSVCCDLPCDGPCEACTAALKGQGEDGACEPVAADTDPDEDCPVDDDYPQSCARDGLCDGQGSCRLAALDSVECQPPTCSNAEATAAAHCDGDGSCVVPSAESCSPYACDVNACRTSCSSDADCLSSYRCDVDDGQCVEMPVCEGNEAVAPDGTREDCTPYRCQDGDCSESCQSTAECASGYRCDSRGDCVDASGMGAEAADSGCGCILAARTAGTRSAGALLLAALALGWAGRRRRPPLVEPPSSKPRGGPPVRAVRAAA